MKKRCATKSARHSAMYTKAALAARIRMVRGTFTETVSQPEGYCQSPPACRSRFGNDEAAELGQIDVAPGNHGDDGSLTGLPGECRGERQCAGAFGNDACLLRQQAHRSLGLFQADDD